MKKVRKLNELSHPESFIQIDYSKGFKYIDRAGEILNLYTDNNRVPDNEIGVGGLLLKQPISNIEQLRVSGTQFWCHFLKPVNLGNVQSAFYKEFEKCYRIIQPAQIIRVGWRNYFILEGLSAEEIQKALGTKTILVDQAITGISSVGKLGDFEAKVELNPLRSTDKKKRALLFDIDVYAKEPLGELSDANAILDSIRRSLTDKIPGIVSGLMK